MLKYIMPRNLAQKLNDGFLELVGYIAALRTIIFGVSYGVSSPEATRGLLWQHISAFPGLSPQVFGWIMAGVGLSAFVGWIFKSKVTVKYTSQVQVLVWLFSAALYLFNESWFTAAITTLPWIVLTFASSYIYISRPDRKNYEELLKELGLDDDRR